MPNTPINSLPPTRVSPLYFIIVLLTISIVAVITYFVTSEQNTMQSTTPDTLQFSTLAGAQKQNGLDLINPSVLLNNTNSPAVGATASEAKVTVVEFLDFQCPYCQVSASMVKQLIARYQGKKVRFIFRNLPLQSLHPYAVTAAHASLCANAQGKFLPMYDVLYTHQSEINPENLYTFARDSNLNMSTFSKCMVAGSYQTQIQKDFSDGVALGAQGTPTWFINGKMFEGALSLETMSAIIDATLATP
ncbi:MAG: thioredoxin domain-containing protein [bacterium]|nr:thioredoxin domain-containing protein [bacterium]